MKNKELTSAEIFALVEAEVKKPDVIPPGFKTLQKWAEEFGKCETTALIYLRNTKYFECRKFATGGRNKINHYRFIGKK